MEQIQKLFSRMLMLLYSLEVSQDKKDKKEKIYYKRMEKSLKNKEKHLIQLLKKLLNA